MSTLDLTARWLGVALRPLATAAAGDDSGGLLFVESLGWTLPSLPPAWSSLNSSADTMQDALASVFETWDLRAAGEASDEDLDQASLVFAAEVASFVQAIAALPDGLRAQLPATYLAATGIADNILPRLYASLFDRFLGDQFPLARSLLVLLGVIDEDDQPEVPDQSQPAFTLVTLHWDRLALVLTDPDRWFGEVYGWRTPALDTARLFDALSSLMYVLAAPTEIHYPSLRFLEATSPQLGPASHTMLEPELWMPVVDTADGGAFVALSPLPQVPQQPQGLAVSLVIRGDLGETFDLTPSVTLALDGTADIGTGLAAVLRPSQSVRIVNDASGAGGLLVDGKVAATVHITRPASRAPLFALANGSQLDVGEVALSLTASGGPASDVSMVVAVSQAEFTLCADDSDGLLSAFLPAGGLVAAFDAQLVWSRANGVHFAGSGNLSLPVPLTVGIGPLALTQIDLVVTAADSLTLGLLLSGNLSIGPVALGLERFGARAALGLHPGNLGSIDLGLAPAAPQGITIAVDAGVVSGAGVLSIGPAAGQYSGGLVLEILGVQVDAFGILDTRPAAGGYSLAVILSTRFPEIPLGFGFTLNGIGGLVALNRRADVDVLRSSLRNGGIDHLLFPADAAADAGRIITELATFFPEANGRYLVGPAAMLGWGSPQLLQAKLLLLLELPAPLRVVLLGHLQLGLPTLDNRLVNIQIDALGVLDIQRGTLALDASLHDSTIAGAKLTGDMALRLAWGDTPQFLFAMGGFNPHFTAPPGFPALGRLALVAGTNPQLQLSAYLALTSNTAQVGAQVVVTAHGAGFEIKGNTGFDALFEFDPFYFETEVTASASISWHGHHLLGLGLDFLLNGPHPWHAKGHASFSILWWDVSVGFDATWGDAEPLPPAQPPAIAGVLTGALSEPSAWTSELTADEPAWVTLASSPSPVGPTSTIAVHPFAALVVRERAVPLGYRITQFANVPLATPQQFAIAGVVVGGAAAVIAPVSDSFAPGQFTQLSADQRLAAPSFESLTSGVRITAAQPVLGATARSSMDVDTVVVDSLPLPPPSPPHPLPPVISVLGPVVRPSRTLPPPPRTGPRLSDLGYVLASIDDLSITAEGAAIAAGNRSYAALRESLAAQVAATGKKPRLQIVPRIQVSNHNARVVVVGQDANMRNVDFVDTVTGRAMTRADFVDAIHAGQYSDYYVRNIHGVPTPVSKPNATTSDNLG